jgi:YesN/AraC family two-component response regulator
MKKKKLNIIVADDEAIQRNVLTNIVQKICPSSEVIACSNGNEVYNILKDISVDIILTDIQMPIMDGMELIKKLSEEFPRIKIILISAYQKFEYAQNAIKCRAIDYLIKPFRVTDVKKIMEKALLEIEIENEKENSLNNYHILAAEAQKQEMHQFLQDMLVGKINTMQLGQEEYKQLEDYGTVAVIRWKDQPVGKEAENSEYSKHLQNALKEQISILFQQLFFVPQVNNFNKFIHKVVMLFPKETATDVTDKLKCIQKQVHQEKIVFWAGISNTKLCLAESAPGALAQAEEMLAFYFYEPEGGVFSYDVLNSIINIPTNSTLSFENQLQQAINNTDRKQIEEILDHMKEALAQGPRCYPSKIKHRVSSMVVRLLMELDKMISKKHFDELLNRAYEMYADCDSYTELFQISKQLFARALQYKYQDMNQFDAIDTCISYIKTHLDTDLSLQRVAEYVHFHPNYLSNKIKNRVGFSYSTFILKLRMELACSLLINTNDKIQDIASKCGFRDSNYFNRIFRREYKLSPEQYRKACRKW